MQDVLYILYVIFYSIMLIQREPILADSCGKQRTQSLRLVKNIGFFKVTQC
jgi:hypothetical protein